MATDPKPCRNPDCEGEFAPASWLPVFCSDDCRQAWCLANGRDRAGEPVLVEQGPADVVMVIEPDLSRYEDGLGRAAEALAAITEVQRSFAALSEMVGPHPDAGPATSKLIGIAPLARLRKRWLG